VTKRRKPAPRRAKRTKSAIEPLIAKGVAMVNDGMNIREAANACDISWSVLARALGLSDGYVSVGQKEVLMQIAKQRNRPITEAERLALQDAIPADTRTTTQRFMGDPLPGRSARDQRAGLRAL